MVSAPSMPIIIQQLLLCLSLFGSNVSRAMLPPDKSRIFRRHLSSSPEISSSGIFLGMHRGIRPLANVSFVGEPEPNIYRDSKGPDSGRPPTPPPPTFLPGWIMGIPLNILSWIFVNYYYGVGSEGAMIHPKWFILNCLVGTYTYGMDRMLDAKEWEKVGDVEIKLPKLRSYIVSFAQILRNTSDKLIKPTNKQALYQYILENYDILHLVYQTIYWIFAAVLMDVVSMEDMSRTGTGGLFLIAYTWFHTPSYQITNKISKIIGIEHDTNDTIWFRSLSPEQNEMFFANFLEDAAPDTDCLLAEKQSSGISGSTIKKVCEDGVRVLTNTSLVRLDPNGHFRGHFQTLFSTVSSNPQNTKIAVYSCILAMMAASHKFENELLYFPFLVALDTTKYYTTIKKQWGILKSAYVGFMWAFAVAVMPTVVNDHSYKVFLDSAVWIPFLGITALSNIADIKDIEEDRINNINTIPVMIGGPLAFLYSLCLLRIASYLV